MKNEIHLHVNGGDDFAAALQRQFDAAAPEPVVDALARPRATTRVRIDAANLLKVGASEVLAMDAGAVSRGVALAPAPSAKPRTVTQTEAVVAVVRIDGPLAQRAQADLCGYVDGYDALAARYAAAHADEASDAVLVIVDSPGGDVAGLEECIRKMQAAQAESGKAVVVHVDELAASAAYWIASGIATAGIFAPLAGRVGSIGCIGAIVDESEALKQAGVSVKLVRAPDGKAEGHPAMPLSELAEKRLRSSVERIAGRFFAHVSVARDIDVEAVKALDAAVLDAADAKRRGLINGVQSLNDSVALAATNGAERRRAREKKHMAENEMAQLRASLEKAGAFEEAVIVAAGAKSASDVVAKIEALKAANAQLQETAGKAAEYEAKLAAVSEEKRQSEIVALVDAGITAKKIAPAQRDEFLAKAQKHGAEYVSDFLAMTSPLVQGPGSAPKATEITEQKVSAELAAALKAAGCTVDDYAKFNAAEQAEG